MYFVPSSAQRNGSRESPYSSADNGDFADNMALRDICQIYQGSHVGVLEDEL